MAVSFARFSSNSFPGAFERPATPAHNGACLSVVQRASPPQLQALQPPLRGFFVFGLNAMPLPKPPVKRASLLSPEEFESQAAPRRPRKPVKSSADEPQ